MLFQITSMNPSTPSGKSIYSSRIAEASEERERKFEVICKIRPLQQAQSSLDIAIGENAPTITIFNHAKNNSKEFTFHRVYGDTMRQSVFSHSLADEVLLNCRQNNRGCLVLSYGVTNSGKTFTIFGSPSEPGILPVLLAKLYPAPVRLRAVQIYNDVIYCLHSGREVKWTDARGVEECGSLQVTSLAHGQAILGEIMRRRKTDETHSNQVSSRSHAVFMVEWEGLHVAITDLAGNEKYGSNSNFSETVKINENLLVLGQCISAFRDGEFIPYRRSRLTQVLMEYFKPSYKIYMIAHLNRSGQMFHQNVNVLEYAAVSTQIRHLQPNPKTNPSFSKSIRRRQRPPESQDEVSVNPGPRQIERKQNRFLLQNYKCYIMGINAFAEADLDEYFRKEDEKDRLFLEELRGQRYVSPEKKRRNYREKVQAQSRIKLRQILREELRLEQLENKAEYGTSMGDSILKLQTNRKRSPSPQQNLHQPSSEPPFESRESTILKYQNFQCSSQRKPQENIIPIHTSQQRLSFSHTVLNSGSVNIFLNNKPDQSLLLDGIPSSKDLSTNRISETNQLLCSSSSTKNQHQPFESIPEAVESETISKSVNQEEKNLVVVLQPETIRQLLQLKLNQTGIKSTQETLLQLARSHSKVTRSISAHKRSNKHHHCNSNAKSSRTESEDKAIDCRRLAVHMTNISGIKTRNQRKMKSIEPMEPKVIEPKKKKRTRKHQINA